MFNKKNTKAEVNKQTKYEKLLNKQFENFKKIMRENIEIFKRLAQK
ncbi:MAG: hypothetical protein LBF97_04315 [Elusimicrobiota bacterium]|jgi:hypothetical protein|nr:hypothetical protein [Elusimicrobiota bacterium]